MNYRELQAAVKAKGLNAKGSKKELEARLFGTKVKPVKADPNGIKTRSFVFTGDPNAPGQDPAWIEMHGYMFGLNGRKITVIPEIAAKLANHSHFTES
jgi:hypothetical protein